MNWILIGQIFYVAVLIVVCMRIIYDTRTASKAIAYLLLAIFLPVVGMILYFSFGINYRKRKLYDKKLIMDEEMMKLLKKNIIAYSEEILSQNDPVIQDNKELAYLLINDLSPLTQKNALKLLVNGENKFPEVLEALRLARHHIHLAYYIFEEGEIGRQIEEVLIQKAKEGVTVRFLYDDFGSRSIRKTVVPRLKAAGILAYPFYKIIFILLANRLNYRNHRKILVVDGQTAFTGGINIGDRYVNNAPGKLYWRDTHLRIDGPGVFYLQYLFLCDWNFASKEHLEPGPLLFVKHLPAEQGALVQMAAGGPDSPFSSVLYSLLQAVYLAQEEILITTPYFIPGESMLDALTVAALSGLSVKLLVPADADVPFVNLAARAYYEELLNAGVEIYLYKKGFIHAKTMVVDTKLSIVGTANMDYRSFELNFEVNAVVYDKQFSEQLRTVFYDDLKESDKIDQVAWANRPAYKQLIEKTAKLLSPLL